MALPSFLKRKTPAAAAQGDEAIVQRARAGARRRLIGAAVLLAAGVIAFPLLFETQPRPIPVDIPIEIPRKDGQPPLAAPPKTARAVTGQVAEPAARAVAEPASSSASSGGAASAPAPEQPAVPVKRAAAVAPAPAPSVSVAAPAPVPPKENKPAAAAPHPKAEAQPAQAGPLPVPKEAAGRFVVQVGAFAEVTAAREVRLKVEKLGLKTYTQVVETGQGRRIRVRVGPFDSQDEAAKVLARLKAAKLPGAVLTL